MPTYKTDWVKEDIMTPEAMNTIEANIEDAAIYLRSILYSIPSLTVRKNRTRQSIDYLDDIIRIEQNIEIIRNNFVTPPNYLGYKAWSKEITFDFTDANRLEFNTRELRDLASKVFSSFRYSGSTTCGGGGLY